MILDHGGHKVPMFSKACGALARSLMIHPTGFATALLYGGLFLIMQFWIFLGGLLSGGILPASGMVASLAVWIMLVPLFLIWLARFYRSAEIQQASSVTDDAIPERQHR